MAEPPANYNTSFSLIDSLVTEIQKFDQVSEASNKISKLASIAKFAVDKVDRAEKLHRDAKEKSEQTEERYKGTQEEIHLLRRDNDGSVELKKTNQVTLEEKDEVIETLQNEFEESKKENAGLTENTSTVEEFILDMKNAFDIKIAEQEQCIHELIVSMAEKEDSIKKLKEENSRLKLARETMRQVSSEPLNNLKRQRLDDDEERTSDMPATRRRKVVATMDKVCLLNLSSTFDKHDLNAAKRQFFEGLVSYRATSFSTSTAIQFNEEKSTQLAGTIFDDLLSLERLSDIQALIFDHNTSPTIPTVLQVLDTEQVALLGDDLLGPAMQSMSSSLEYIAADYAGMKNTNHRKMLYLWDHYLNFQKQIGLVQELYRKDRNIPESLRMGSVRALKANGSRWHVTATITDYLLSVTTASDENREEIARTLSLLIELVACWGKGVLVLISWAAVNTLGNEAGVVGLPIVCEVLLNATGARFERYCELLERHVWDPIMAGIPIFIDLSAVDRPVTDIMEEFDRR